MRMRSRPPAPTSAAACEGPAVISVRSNPAESLPSRPEDRDGCRLLDGAIERLVEQLDEAMADHVHLAVVQTHNGHAVLDGDGQGIPVAGVGHGPRTLSLASLTVRVSRPFVPSKACPPLRPEPARGPPDPPRWGPTSMPPPPKAEAAIRGARPRAPLRGLHRGRRRRPRDPPRGDLRLPRPERRRQVHHGARPVHVDHPGRWFGHRRGLRRRDPARPGAAAHRRRPPGRGPRPEADGHRAAAAPGPALRVAAGRRSPRDSTSSASWSTSAMPSTGPSAPTPAA